MFWVAVLVAISTVFYDIDSRCQHPLPGDARHLRIQWGDGLHRMRSQRHLAFTVRMLRTPDARRASSVQQIPRGNNKSQQQQQQPT